MGKTSTVQQKRDTERAARVKKTARITGFSEDYVRKVLALDRENDEVMAVYMQLQETETQTENKLLTQVKNLVPFP